jgi:EmrB/QacA subfamily drug resistance transporter
VSLSPATTAAPPDTTLSARRLTAVVGVLSLAVFMSSLDLFIVNLAFPYIGREYAGTGLGSLSWILNGYTIVFAAVLVPAGRWADRVGRRKLFVAGLAAFVVGSLFCGLAPGVAALIAARVVQAAGAGLMVPASLSLLLAAVPAEARSRAIGTWSAIGALGAALGPVIGGSLVQFSWRWVFWINLPVGIVAILLASKVVPESKDDHVTGRPDVAGAGLLAAAVALVALALVKAPDWGWGSAGFVGLLLASLACGAAMVVRSHRHHSPVIELGLLRSRSFSGAFAASIFYYAAFGAFVLNSVEFLTGVWHYSAVRAGLAIGPGPLMVLPFARVAAPWLAARLGGPGRVAVIGCLVNAGAQLLWLSQIQTHPAYLTHLLPAQLLGGAGVGLTVAAWCGHGLAETGPLRHRERDPEHGPSGRHRTRGRQPGRGPLPYHSWRPAGCVPQRPGVDHRVLRRRRRCQRRPADHAGPAAGAARGSVGRVSTRVVQRGEGERRYTARGSVMLFKALAEQDGGDFSLMERTLPPGGRRPPPHRHMNCSEAYFVLDGLVSVTVEGEDLEVGPEGFVLVPRGTGHTFGNAGEQEARLLVIHAPAMDAYFAGLHELWLRDKPPTPDEERQLMARFGMNPA